MKKQLLSLCFVFAGMVAFGQSSVPNGDFENWTSATLDNPQNYPNTSNSENYFRHNLPFNITKTTDAFHGSYAVKLETVASATDTSFGYFININPQNEPSAWTGGVAYDQKPTGIRGWYKYNVATADSGTIIIAFSKAGINVGTYFYKIGGIHSDYTPFNFTFSPALSVTPDSVAFGALSCQFLQGQDQPKGPAGSILVLDSLSFTGVGSQPAQMNGDFETWLDQTYYNPEDWYVQSENGAGFNRTSDAAVGDYAMELITYAGNQNNHAAARAGRISTGYYPDNCNGNCQQLGGYPFTSQVDTLAFYFKYAPTDPNDHAMISISLKKDGQQYWGNNLNLIERADYTYAEFPINPNSPEVPDSIIIDIQSSLWQDSTMAYVGADLKIDDIHFKSQVLPTGIFNHRSENSISVYPNPTSGKILISGLNSGIQRLDIYNMSGEIVYSSGPEKRTVSEVDLTGRPKGIYFIKIDEGNRIQTQKFVIR